MTLPNAEPLVTIIVLTFNQVNFIQQTIESLLAQETSFNYKILICDDGSTDQNPKLLKSLYGDNEKIKLILRKFNIGMMPNFIDALDKCESKYIAFCDGDDYWIDNHKLATQVAILEEKLNVDITATRAMIKYPNSDIVHEGNLQHTTNYISFTDLLKGNKLVASSVMIRNYNIKMPEWTKTSIFGDWPFYLLSIQTDSLIHIGDDYSIVYRKDVGVTKNNGVRRAYFLKGTNRIYENLLTESKFHPYVGIIKDAVFLNKFYLMGTLNQTGEKIDSFKILIEILRIKNIITPLQILKRYLKTLF